VDANRSALLNAQSPIGGFGKEAGEFPGKPSPPNSIFSILLRSLLSHFTPADPYHSYLAIAALAMTDNDEASAEKGSLGLVDLDPVWNVSRATKTWLEGVLRGIRHP
jgi:geranylgeranyl transferase type-1 subunit beta